MIRKLLNGRVPSANAIMFPGQWRNLGRWYLSRQKDYLLKHRIPWLTFDAVPVIEEFVRPGMNIFEYGSGSSTLWWSKLGASVISIEHDEHWFNVLSSYITPSDNIQLQLIRADTVPCNTNATPDDPYGYRTQHYGFENATFKAYVSSIDYYPDSYFSVILVDGQARPSCIRHALPKLRSDGLLIIDNANVDTYLAKTMPLLQALRRVSFKGLAPIDGALSQTDLYFA